MVGLCEHRVVLVQREVLGQQLVRQLVDLEQRLQLHDACEVAGLEARDRQVQGLLEAVVDPLADEPVEVDGAAEQLDVALAEQRDVAVRVRVGDVRAQGLALLPEPLVQQDAAGQVLVVGVDLLAQLVDELVEAEVHLGLDFVVEELLSEHGEGVVGRVVVEIQWV